MRPCLSAEPRSLGCLLDGKAMEARSSGAPPSRLCSSADDYATAARPAVLVRRVFTTIMRTPPSRARRHDGSDANGQCVEWVVLYKQLFIDRQIAMEAAPIEWDITSIAAAVDADEVEAEVDAACRRFAARYRGRLGSLSPAELVEALAELGRIRGALVHLTGVARLRVATNVDGAAARAAGAKADAVATGAEEL